VLLRTKDEVSNDNLAIMAAGVAFFAMLAIFPALIGLVSIYGLVADPAEIEKQLDNVSSMLPAEARVLIADYLRATVQNQDSTLGLAAILGILGALWSASSGTGTMMQAINVVYDEKEKRSFIRSRSVALALTFGMIVIVLIAVALLAVVPVVLNFAGLSQVTDTLLSWGRWPLLIVLGLLGLAGLYRFGPDRADPKWRWVTPGSLLAVLSWLIVSAGFSLYAANFGNFGKTYGPLASVVVLLTWLYLSAFVILLGAELNAELESQTRKDSTTGPEKPMGERGAEKADHLGAARG
jgi:membrane protein